MTNFESFVRDATRMDMLEVQKRDRRSVNELMLTDEESAHIVEDRSLRRALSWISKQGGPSAEVAQDALRITEIEYSRGCAPHGQQAT